MPFNTIDQRGIQFGASLFRFIKGETIASSWSPQIATIFVDTH